MVLPGDKKLEEWLTCGRDTIFSEWSTSSYISEQGERNTMEWILTLISLVAYVVGLILLVRIVPRLVKRSFDEALFIVVAAVAVFGAMLAFGAIGVTFGVFGGHPAVRVLDAILLIVLFIVALRTSFGAFRPRYGIGVGSYRSSRIMAGIFFLIVAVAAIYVLVLLFKPA